MERREREILTEDELNYLFDCLTRENQTQDINAALMAQLQRREEKPAPKPLCPQNIHYCLSRKLERPRMEDFQS